MFEIYAALPAEIVPLSWLLGVWEGSGVIAYTVGDAVREHEFGQRVAFTREGGTTVQYASSSWLLDDSVDLTERTPLFSEIGYWRLSRKLGPADQGPGMLPGVGDPVFTNAEAVETLRNATGGFDLEVTILHPTGVSELYLGTVNGPPFQIQVVRIEITLAFCSAAIQRLPQASVT